MSYDVASTLKRRRVSTGFGVLHWQQWQAPTSAPAKRLNQTPECGNQSFEINNCAIITMKEIGRGHTALKTFCGFMNMPPPIQIKSCNKMQQNIASVYQDVANDSMKSASDELRNIAN